MTTLVRWDPLREVTALRDMSRLFGRSVGEGGAWTPALDVFETADAIVVEVDLPGLSGEEIDIELDDGTLTISGERSFLDRSVEGRFSRLERSYGAFRRRLRLPPTVLQDEISADFDRGVLTVRVPKAQELRPRKIAVGTGAGAVPEAGASETTG